MVTRTTHLTSTSVKRVCDINRLKTAGTCYNQENADTQCQQLGLTNLEGADILGIQQLQLQQIQQPECQVHEMDENSGMRLKKKTTESWTNKKKLKRLNVTNLENQNPVAVARVVGQQNYTASDPRVDELCMETEETHQNSLRKFGQNLPAVTQAVHLIGQDSMWEKFYVPSKSLQLLKQNIPFANSI